MAKQHEDGGTPKAVPFRITIGVTGHRQINDSDLLRETIRKIQADIARRYAFSPSIDLRFCVLSPLAEGADRVVADTILDNQEFKDATIKAVLPMSVDDYRNDFSSQRSCEQFEELMASAKVTLTLRDQTFAEEYAELASNVEMIAEARRQAYEDVGRFVVDHCDVMIALWDGKSARGKGGTATIVSYATEVKCPLYIIDPDRPAQFRIQPPGGKGDDFQGLDHCFKSVEHFNQQLQSRPAPTEYVANIFLEVFGPGQNAFDTGLASETKAAIKSHLMPYYALASQTAKSYQQIYRLVGLANFWLAFLAVLIIGIGAIFFHSGSIFFAFELAILLVISGLILYADRYKRSHKRWMQFRFLTERIRSGFFLAGCGLTMVPAHLRRRVDGEPNSDIWMEMVFEEIWNTLPDLKAVSTANFKALGEFIQTQWIDHQINYHQPTALKNQLYSHRLEAIGAAVFWVATAAAAVHLVMPFIFSGFHDWFIAHCLTLAALILPALAATVEAIRSHREYKRMAVRSSRINSELQQLKRRFKLLTPEKLKRNVYDLAKLMQSESEEWLTMMAVAELHVAV